MPENLRFEPMELLSWPDAPDDVVLSVKRMDVADEQRMWVITNSKSGYKLRDASRLSSGEWLSFAAGEPHANDYRVSCIRFDDVMPPDLIPALLHRDGNWIIGRRSPTLNSVRQMI